MSKLTPRALLQATAPLSPRGSSRPHSSSEVGRNDCRSADEASSTSHSRAVQLALRSRLFAGTSGAHSLVDQDSRVRGDYKPVFSQTSLL